MSADPPRGIDHEDATAAPNPWPVIRAGSAPARHRPFRPGAGLLATATIAAALSSAAPAVLEMADAWRLSDAQAGFLPARWALVLGWLCLLQLAYGAYLWQWNDLASVRVFAIALVGFAGTYAAALAVVLFADPHGWIAGRGGLDFADKLPGGKAALWCLCLVSLTTALAYFAARLSMRRQQADLLSRGVR